MAQTLVHFSRIRFILDIYNNLDLLISGAPYGRPNMRARMPVSKEGFMCNIVKDLVGNMQINNRQ